MAEFYSQKGLVYSLQEADPFAFGRTSVFFRATNPEGLQVCIKVFRKLEDMPPDLDEFLREITARQHVQHKHVLPILDFGVQEVQPPRPFLVLPYCQGGDLRELMGKRDLVPLHEALPFLRPLASAIDCAHDGGLIHGDIKPENILFGASATDVFLADFGAIRQIVVRARVSGVGPRQRRGTSTPVQAPEGTELYLSPEELEDGAQSPLSDIYSFGFVTYELLTGRLPIDPKSSPYRQMKAKIDGNLTDPSQANPRLPQPTRDALLTALNVDPSLRPRSATTFCDMLEGIKPARATGVEGNRIDLFFSYAHEDEAQRDELAKHLSVLQRRGTIAGWHDREVTAGTEWRGEIHQRLETARVILLLISADFLASDYCYDVEMKHAIERHRRGDAVVIPIIIRPVTWSETPFAELQALPKDGKAVTTWKNRDAAYTDIAEGITRAVSTLSTKRVQSKA